MPHSWTQSSMSRLMSLVETALTHPHFQASDRLVGSGSITGGVEFICLPSTSLRATGLAALVPSRLMIRCTVRLLIRPREERKRAGSLSRLSSRWSYTASSASWETNTARVLPPFPRAARRACAGAWAVAGKNSNEFVQGHQFA